jgi:hypothetical protein
MAAKIDFSIPAAILNFFPQYLRLTFIKKSDATSTARLNFPYIVNFSENEVSKSIIPIPIRAFKFYVACNKLYAISCMRYVFCIKWLWKPKYGRQLPDFSEYKVYQVGPENPRTQNFSFVAFKGETEDVTENWTYNGAWQLVCFCSNHVFQV